MSESEKFYSEAAIADKLQLPRDDVHFVRESILKKDEGWIMAGRAVALTEAGLTALLAELAIDPIDFSDCVIDPEKKEDGVVELTVTRIFPNRVLLQAQAAPGEPLVTVRVKDNANFRPKMKLKARPPAEGAQPSFYRLEGRCPRYPGRW